MFLLDNLFCMFDDIPVQGGSVPPNLPIGEPEDIFAAVPGERIDDTPAPLLQSTPPSVTPEGDMSVGKTALSAGMLQPKQMDDMSARSPERNAPMSSFAPETTPPPQPFQPLAPRGASEQYAPSTQPGQQGKMTTHTMPTDAPEMYTLKDPKVSKGIITIIVVVVVVLVLGGGGLFIYNQFVAGSTSNNALPSIDVQDTTAGSTFDTIDMTDTIQPIDTVDTSASTGTINRPPENTDSILFGESPDVDADGLDDERERGLGTDPEHWDTDGDDLSDGDEVIIWKTDPLNPDTDGDGFKDGEEIKNGYSPTGPGKIFEPPTGEAS